MRRHRHEELLQHLEKMLAVLEKSGADGQVALTPRPGRTSRSRGSPLTLFRVQVDDEGVLAQLASNGEVEVSFGGDLSAKVQLGGSCAEDSEVAWAVQQLLLRLQDAKVS